jgi:hypothetical protein
MGKKRITVQLSEGKGHPITGHKGPTGGRGGRGIALLILDLGARRGWVVSTTPRPLYPQEIPGTHCTRGWVGPQGRSGRVRKISPPPGQLSDFQQNNFLTSLKPC